jgi:hypothetical protein
MGEARHRLEDKIVLLQLILEQLILKVKVTLRLAVYRQSVRFAAKALETHDQRVFSSTEPLRYVASSLMRR